MIQVRAYCQGSCWFSFVTDDRLWIDKYEPGTEVSKCRARYNISPNKDKAELAVHVRKVEDVRRWITEAFDGGPSGKLTKYRVSHTIPILVLF
jgi:hypothetical protein